MIWPQIERALINKKWKYSIYWTDTKSACDDIVKIALYQQPDLLISLGGDGTAHTVLQSLYKYHDLSTKTRFTVYPNGTGNDWARYWKIPHDINAWIAMIDTNHTYDHDLGVIEYTHDDGSWKKEYFNNVAGMAYDAYVADFIESKKKKMTVGGIQYLYFIFRCLFGYQLQKSRIIWPSGEQQDKFYTINVGICPYSGGGIRIVPHAIPQDGALAVTAIRPLNKLQVLLISWHFYTGKLHQHRKALAFQTDELYVQPLENEIIKIEADGEYLGRLPAKFKIIKHAFKICAP